MTEENKDEEIKLIPADDNPWYKFYLQSIVLDRADEGEGPYGIKPHGWHWFWGIYFLHQRMPQFRPFNLTEIQKSLPDEHWLKNATDEEDLYSSSEVPDSACQGEAMRALHEILQEHKIKEAPEEIDFSNLDFKEHIDLSRFIFPIKVSFRDSNFHKSANFTQAQFFNSVCFDGTVFIGNESFFLKKGSLFSHTTFQDAKFHHHVTFSSASFTEAIGFRNVKFFQGASFNDAVFSTGVRFEKAEFIYSGASFKKTKFSNIASFAEVTFSRGAFFEGAEFPESPFYVDFSGANFETGGFFNDAKFLGEAIFYNAIFGGSTVFRGAIFSTLAKFGKADISGSINFIDAHFKTRVPYLHDAKIGTGILWDRNDNFWPQPKQDKDNETDTKYKNRIANNQNDYEALVSHMQKLDKHDDEHFFFRQEMRWRRLENKLTRKPSKKYFNWKLIEDNLTIFFFWLYEVFADYGYGIGRAFSWWLGHIFIGAIVIAIIAWYACVGLQETLFCSVSLSVANANPFVLIVIEDGSLIDCYNKLNKLSPMIFGAVRGIQTFIGVSLLFLLLLTLRIRFRLK